MAVWMEDSRKDSFKICLKESKIFDGVHKNIEVVSKVVVTTRQPSQIKRVKKNASVLKMIISIYLFLCSPNCN